MMDSCRLTSVDELVNSAGNAQHIREDHSNVNILQQAEKYINQSFQHEDKLECVESGISPLLLGSNNSLSEQKIATFAHQFIEKTF